MTPSDRSIALAKISDTASDIRSHSFGVTKKFFFSLIIRSAFSFIVSKGERNVKKKMFFFGNSIQINQILLNHLL